MVGGYNEYGDDYDVHVPRMWKKAFLLQEKKKAFGTKLLKAGSPVLSIYLAQIYNLQLASGFVPKCFKIGYHLLKNIECKLSK